MKKKLFVMTLLCATMLSVAACGKSDNSDKQQLDMSTVESTESSEFVDLSDTPVAGNYFGVYAEDSESNVAFYMTTDEVPTLTFSTEKFGTLTGNCEMHDNYISFGSEKCDYIMDFNGNLTFTYHGISYGMVQITEDNYSNVLAGRDVTELTLDTTGVESVESTEETETVDGTEETSKTEDATETESVSETEESASVTE